MEREKNSFHSDFLFELGTKFNSLGFNGNRRFIPVALYRRIDAHIRAKKGCDDDKKTQTTMKRKSRKSDAETKSTRALERTRAV